MSINVRNFYNPIKFSVFDEDVVTSDLVGSNTLAVNQIIIKKE